MRYTLGQGLRSSCDCNSTRIKNLDQDKKLARSGRIDRIVLLAQYNDDDNPLVKVRNTSAPVVKGKGHSHSKMNLISLI